MNEGCATYVHYRIMNRLYDLGRIGEGAMLEFSPATRTSCFSRIFDDPRFSGLNPYALGFEMMRDIERVVTDPTDEDRAYLPQIAGNGDVMGTLKIAWAEFRDDSFIAQYLSPRLIRKAPPLQARRPVRRSALSGRRIHDERGYERVRRALARQYDPGHRDPNLQVDRRRSQGNRRLDLTHRLNNDVPLTEQDALSVLSYIADLWGYDVLSTASTATDGTLPPRGIPAG